MQGIAAHSMQWGAWGGAGMASNPTLRARLERVGMGSIRPAQGLTALALALQQLDSKGQYSDLVTIDFSNTRLSLRLIDAFQESPCADSLSSTKHKTLLKVLMLQMQLFLL